MRFLKYDLEQSKLIGLQSRKCINEADERIELAIPEREHELASQAELNNQFFFSRTRIPCLFQCACARLEYCVAQICLESPLDERCVVHRGYKLSGDALGDAKQFKGDWFTTKGKIQEKLLKGLFVNIEFSRERGLQFDKVTANEWNRFGFLVRCGNCELRRRLRAQTLAKFLNEGAKESGPPSVICYRR